MTPLTGTGAMVRLALRRDRVMLPVWTLVAVGYLAVQGAGVAGLYDTAAEREQYAATMAASPTTAAFNGFNYALTTLGGIIVAESNFTALVILALVSSFLMIRYTRAEEEAGRAELTGSAVLGRHARLAAAVLVVAGLNVVIGLLLAVVMLGFDLPVAGSVAFAGAMAGVGLVFAAIGAVAAQVVENARTARGLAAAALGVLYLPRAIGDASRTADPDSALAGLTWLSPLGWALQIRAFAGERWWVLGLMAATTVILVAVAVSMGVRRDVAAGLVRPRPGPAKAAPGLASALGLAWRLQRGSLIGWTVGFAVMGVAMGAVAHELGGMLESNPDMVEVLRQIGGAGGLVDLFVSATMGIAGLAASAYAVASLLRLRSEETGLLAEPVLGTAVSRWRWAGSHLVVTAAGTVVLMAALGLFWGLAYGLRAGDLGGNLADLLGAALVQVPAAWVVGAVALALFGLVPRLTIAGAWLTVVGVMLLGQFGDLLQLDQWAMNLSPFTHVPTLPGGEFTATPMLWLVAVAAALAAAGMAGFRRRDLS